MKLLGIPQLHLTVLGAITQPDPRPPVDLDSPAAAVCRRLPELADADAAEVLCTLNALGLTKVPYIAGMVSPARTADLTKWITVDGWAALGVGLTSTTN